MSTEKLSFFLKLNPPRASFMMDMTDNEREIMKQHVTYWQPYVADGTVLVLGPVMDPAGGYGMAILRVDSTGQLDTLVANDPANGLNNYEVHPMRVVSKFV